MRYRNSTARAFGSSASASMTVYTQRRYTPLIYRSDRILPREFRITRRARKSMVSSRLRIATKLRKTLRYLTPGTELYDTSRPDRFTSRRRDICTDELIRRRDYPRCAVGFVRSLRDAPPPPRMENRAPGVLKIRACGAAATGG